MELLKESNFNEIEILSEATQDGNKNWYISGVYAQAEVVNRNKRIYPAHVLDESMNDYIENYVNKNRAYGEMEHPNSLSINMDRISHRIVEMKKDGNNYIGKAKILNTPCGKLVAALLEDTPGCGVSTRSGGTTKKNSKGIMEVIAPLRMKCVDIVLDNSAPDAFCQAMMESAPFLSTIQEADEEFLANLREELDTNGAYKLQEKKLEAFKKFVKHITEGISTEGVK